MWLHNIRFPKQRFRSFNDLIRNFNKNLSIYSQYSPKINEDCIKFLDKIRFEGNESAHSIEERVTKQSLEDLREDIEYYIHLFSSTMQKL